MKDKILKTLVLIITIVLLIGIGYSIYIIFNTPINYSTNYERVMYLKNIAILIMQCSLLIVISKWLVSYYYPLLGAFCSSISFLLMFIPLLIGGLILIFKVGFSNGVKDLILYIVFLLFVVIIVVSEFKTLINCVKDYFIGKQETILKSFSVSYERNRRNPNYYILNGKDINGNEIELKSIRKILNKRTNLKVKYYENIKMIESFEYLEKNS